jgi:hypothetical protein
MNKRLVSDLVIFCYVLSYVINMLSNMLVGRFGSVRRVTGGGLYNVLRVVDNIYWSKFTYKCWELIFTGGDVGVGLWWLKQLAAFKLSLCFGCALPVLSNPSSCLGTVPYLRESAGCLTVCLPLIQRNSLCLARLWGGDTEIQRYSLCYEDMHSVARLTHFIRYNQERSKIYLENYEGEINKANKK